jgi:apolipoprotein N-acyltransferase
MITNAVAYPLTWRIIGAILMTIGRVSLPFLLVLVLVRTYPISAMMLIRSFSILFIAPTVAAWLIERAFAVTVQITSGVLVIERHALRVEVPCRAIARITPWTIPLPGSGLWLRLQSGRRFRYGLQLADPSAVLDALADRVGSQSTAVARQHPSLIYAHAKQADGPWRWHHLVFKFVIFALVPTLPLFRLKQFITYGGTFGLYYQQGLEPYLQAFGLYWVQLVIAVMLYAGPWRGMAEAAALFAAWAAPSRAARVRQIAEIGCRVLYYAGIPFLLIWYFFSS